MKFLICILLIAQLLNAKEYGILVYTAKVVYQKNRDLFIKRFPNGIVKKYGKYYEFKVEPFYDYKSAKKELQRVKKYYNDAFIININSCSSNLKAKKREKEKISTPIIVKTPAVNYVIPNKKEKKSSDISVPSYSKKPILQKKQKISKIIKNHREIEPAKIREAGDKRPGLNLPQVLEQFEVPDKRKTVDTQKYDILSFKRYKDVLLESNDKSDEIYYKRKVNYILREIKKDRYNFDIFADAYIRTGSSISAQSGIAPNVNGEYSGAGVSINANKLLYDGGYHLIKHTYDILYKRLADIKALNEKNKLLILGFSIYSNLYISQMELDIYKKIYKEQKIMLRNVEQRYKIGKDTPIDLIDARNDLLNLERSILTLRYGYLSNDFILRHSIKSRSRKPFKLLPAKIKLKLDPLVLLQKEALVNSGLIARESDILKIKQTDLLFQLKRRDPTLRFHSFLGYGLSTTKSFSLSNPGRGAFWEIGLNLRIPIYKQNDINLNEEKEKLNVLKQKSILSQRERDVLNALERSYNLALKSKREIKILIKQISLLKQKMNISKVRYENGISGYKDYSNAIKGYLLYQLQLLKLKENLKQNILIISLETGKKDIYE